MRSFCKLILHRRIPLLATTPLLLVCLLGAGRPTSSTEAVEDVSFADQVWPILENACLQCHDKATAYSNLRLDSPERILRGGDLGKVVIAGDPENSSLLTRVSLPQDDLDFMPIEGDPLDEEQIEALRRWIEQGADFGTWTGTE